MMRIGSVLELFRRLVDFEGGGGVGRGGMSYFGFTVKGLFFFFHVSCTSIVFLS